VATEEAKRRVGPMRIALGLGIVALLGAGAVFGPDLWGAMKFQNALDQEATIASQHGRKARDLAQTCGLCHGLEGNGKSQFYAHLAGEPAAYLEAQLNSFGSGTRKSPQMQPLAMDLTPEERRSISAYYASFPATPNVGFRASHSIDPRLIPLATACAACHGEKFEGATTPVLSPRLAGQAREYLVRQLRAFRSGDRTDPTGSMTSLAKSLEDPEIEALADYLASR